MYKRLIYVSILALILSISAYTALTVDDSYLQIETRTSNSAPDYTSWTHVGTKELPFILKGKKTALWTSGYTDPSRNKIHAIELLNSSGDKWLLFYVFQDNGRPIYELFEFQEGQWVLLKEFKSDNLSGETAKFLDEKFELKSTELN